MSLLGIKFKKFLIECCVLLLTLPCLTGADKAIPPKILQKHQGSSEKTTLTLGKRYQLLCTVSEGDLPLTIRWMKNGQSISSSADISVRRFDDYSSSMVIQSVTEYHSGNYSCVVSNAVGMDSLTVMLQINVEPFWVQQPVDTRVIVNSDVELPCKATGNPDPTINWKKAPGLLSDQLRDVPGGGRFRVSQDGSLTISRAEGTDEGFYVCIAGNQVGKELKKTIKVDVLVPPQVGEKYRLVTEKTGQWAFLNCSVGGDKPMKIIWKKNGYPVDPANDNRMTLNEVEREDGLESGLRLGLLSSSDSGVFVCSAENAHGRTDIRFRLVVVASVPPKLQRRIEKIELMKGERYQELCTVSVGDIPINFRWLKNGQTVSTGTQDVVIRRMDSFTSSLVIESVTEYSSGNYSCVVSNAAGIDSYTVNLHVNVPPVWVRQPVDVSALAGKEIQIPCEAVGSPEPKVLWKKAKGVIPDNPQELKTNGRVRMTSDGTLSITTSSDEDEGFYVCHASNGIGPGLKKTIKVDVLVPPKITEPFQTITQRKGQPVEILCNVSGDSPLLVTWKKEHNVLGNDDKISITQSEAEHAVFSVLRLDRPNSEDSGLYLCSARNEHGRSNMRARLTVVEVPGPPESISLLRAWSRSVQIGWEMPYNGNSPITKFVVEYRKDKDERDEVKRREFRASDVTAILDDLSPWTRYRVWVAAENIIGYGEFSDPVVVLTKDEEPSAAPSNFRIELVKATSARVSWQHLRQKDWNGQLLGYYVGYKGYDDKSSFGIRSVPMNETSSGQSYVLTGLQKVSSYKVMVRAFNSAGAGPETDPLTFQTKSGAPPSTPKLRLLSARDTLCEVQIQPDSFEDEVEDYLLHVKRHQRAWEEMPLSSTGIHVLGGLSADTQYQMFVTARNPFGASEPSQVLTFLTSRPSFLADDGEPLWGKMSVVLPTAASALLVFVVCCVSCCMARRLSKMPKREGVAANDFSYTRPSTSRSESACFYNSPSGVLPAHMQHRPPASLPRAVRALQYSEPRCNSPIEEPKYECVVEEMKTFIGAADRRLGNPP